MGTEYKPTAPCIAQVQEKGEVTMSASGCVAVCKAIMATARARVALAVWLFARLKGGILAASVSWWQAKLLQRRCRFVGEILLIA